MIINVPGRFVRKSHGSVVSLCGVAGYGGFPNMLPFVASKFAIRGLMEGLYIELRYNKKKAINILSLIASYPQSRQKYPRHKIHLMTVAPFSIDTGMVQGSLISFPGN